jgi:hypothetical protein
LLAALWSAWAGYAWLTNTVDAEQGAVGRAMLVAMAAMFVAALAVPDAFDRHGVVFGVALLIVLLMHLALFALAGRSDPDLLAAVMRMAPSAVVGGTLIVAAGFVQGGLRPFLWLAALAVGYFGPLFGGMSGWRVHPAHFAERHGLIVIIALGESLRSPSGWGRPGESRSTPARTMCGISKGVIVARDEEPKHGRSSRSARSTCSPNVAVRSAPSWRAMPTPTCTCRWWSASSCSHSR